MLRGINRQDIFIDREDYRSFLFTLARAKKETGCRIFGYCLMRNHVHLLLQEGEDPLESTMKRIGASYVYWYNRKYKRTGHLFQDRFKSEPVEDDPYLLVVLRYIHNNPLVAGLVEKAGDYQWSSYNDYLVDSPSSDLTDTAFILGIFDSDRARARELFKQFSVKSNRDRCLEHDEYSRSYLSDNEIISIIKKHTSLDDPTTLRNADNKVRDSLIRSLREEGATIRQLVKLTGISKSIIERT
jgi:REP element-mobilizing transposase RayT